MRPEETTIPDAPSLEHPAMLEAMKRGVAEALRKHRDQGVAAIVWDTTTQQVVEIPADRMPAWIDELNSSD